MILKEALMNMLIRKLIAEFLGTFTIVLGGCGAIAVDAMNDGNVSHLGVATAFGLSVTIMIFALGHVSGAHFNPAVTIAFALKRHFPKKQILPYLLAQASGAIAASALHVATLKMPDGSMPPLGVTQPYDDIWMTAFIWEFVLTLILMVVIMAMATDYRAVGTFAAPAIGATVWLEALFAGPICNASMNPFRSLAPALLEGHWVHFSAFILGPVLGAIAGAFIYDIMRCDTGPKEEIKGCC